MSLNECLLGNEFFEQKGIMALSDTPSANGMTAAELKAAFDDLSKNYVGKNFNKLINMLTELGVESLIQSGDIGYVRLNAEYENGRQSSMTNKEMEEKIALLSNGTLVR